MLVCGTAFDPRTTTAVELRGVGEITAESLLGLSQLANVRTLLVSDSTFSDAGWAALMEVVRGLPVSELGVSGCALGPRHAADLADYVLSAGGSLTTLRCGSNPGMVGELDRHGRLKTPDAHIESFRQLCEALKPSQVTEVDFSGCGLGPLGAGCVADYVRNAIAALVEVNLSGCPLTGATYEVNDAQTAMVWKNIDSKMEGFIALCSVIGKVHTLSLSDCHLGPASAAELSKLLNMC